MVVFLACKCRCNGGLFLYRLGGDALTGVVVGNECLDWTSFGSGLGLIGSGLMVLVTWCFEVLAMRPDFIIEECTPRFKGLVFEHIFGHLSGGQYHIQRRTFSPVDLGFPASRPRQYMILTRVDSMTVTVPFAGAMVEQVFFRRLMMDGKVFFTDVGGPREHLAYKRHLMKARGLAFADRRVVLKRSALSLLPSAKQIRLHGYRKLAARMGKTQGIVDINQTAGYCNHISPVVPTLLRTSVMADIDTGNVLLPSAHFDVMAVPVHRPAQSTYRVPLTPLLPSLTPQDMQSLTGNAMHAGAVGMCLMYVLGFCDRHKDQ